VKSTNNGSPRFVMLFILLLNESLLGSNILAGIFSLCSSLGSRWGTTPYSRTAQLSVKSSRPIRKPG